MPSRHTGVFALLLGFSLLNPKVVFGISMPLAPVTLLLISLSLFWTIYNTVGFKAIWREYRVEILLCAAYVMVSLLSLMVNFQRYDNLAHIVYSGLGPIALWTAFPMLLLLFSLQTKDCKTSHFWHNPVVAWGFFLLLALIGIWQAVDYDSTAVVTRYFMSSLYDPSNRNVNSLLNISTDFGPVMAFSALCLVSFLRRSSQPVRTTQKWLVCAMILVFISAGLLSGSANFVAILLVGGWLLLFGLLKKYPWRSVLGSIVVICVAHIVILQSTTAVWKIGSIFPYVVKLKNDQALVVDDFIPHVKNASFQARFVLWKQASLLWRDNPLIGVSGGGFKSRATSMSAINNTHNLILQTVTDAGVLGLIIALLLFYRLFKRAGGYRIPLLGALIINLTFDYYLDHSLPWMLCISWLIINSVPDRMPIEDGTGVDEHQSTRAMPATD